MRAVIAALALAVSAAAFAIDAERAFDDPALQERYEHLTRALDFGFDADHDQQNPRENIVKKPNHYRRRGKDNGCRCIYEVQG